MTSRTLAPDKTGTLMVHGYGIVVKVDCGHLIIEGGVGLDRTHTRLHKVTGKLKRLIIMGHDGYLTIDALLYLREADAAVMVLDRDGELLFTSTATPHKADVKLRRAQVMAAFTETGLDIARTLLGMKMKGQAAVLRELHDDRPHVESAVMAIDGCVEGLGRHNRQDTLRLAEAQAADMYWRCLSVAPVQFAKGAKVPDHWHHWGQRHSPLTHSCRGAVTPANAILNYLYALLEGETRQALMVAGLDPQLGYNHVDTDYRDSLAADVMEACRPDVDRWVLKLLAARTFTARDFGETDEGVCRLAPALAAELAATMPYWQAAVAPVVRMLVSVLRHADMAAPAQLNVHQEADARRLTVVRPAKVRAVHDVPLAPAAAPASRVCSHCQNVAAAPIEREGRWYCSDVCADAADTLRRYAVILQDQSTWTPDAWAALWPALRRVPQTRMRALMGWSSAMSSMVVTGKERPAAKNWQRLCEGLAAA